MLLSSPCRYGGGGGVGVVMTMVVLSGGVHSSRVGVPDWGPHLIEVRMGIFWLSPGAWHF